LCAQTDGLAAYRAARGEVNAALENQGFDGLGIAGVEIPRGALSVYVQRFAEHAFWQRWSERNGEPVVFADLDTFVGGAPEKVQTLGDTPGAVRNLQYMPVAALLSEADRFEEGAGALRERLQATLENVRVKAESETGSKLTLALARQFNCGVGALQAGLQKIDTQLGALRNAEERQDRAAATVIAEDRVAVQTARRWWNPFSWFRSRARGIIEVSRRRLAAHQEQIDAAYRLSVIDGRRAAIGDALKLLASLATSAGERVTRLETILRELETREEPPRARLRSVLPRGEWRALAERQGFVIEPEVENLAFGALTATVERAAVEAAETYVSTLTFNVAPVNVTQQLVTDLKLAASPTAAPLPGKQDLNEISFVVSDRGVFEIEDLEKSLCDPAASRVAVVRIMRGVRHENLREWPDCLASYNQFGHFSHVLPEVALRHKEIRGTVDRIVSLDDGTRPASSVLNAKNS
jgi:hypothetical protein